MENIMFSIAFSSLNVLYLDLTHDDENMMKMIVIVLILSQIKVKHIKR